MRREAIRNARVAPGTLACETCDKRMKENPKDRDKEYRVDHIVPASEPAKLIVSFDDLFERMFVPASGLQVMCTECHDVKTRGENEIRSRTKSKKKPAIRRRVRKANHNG